QRGAPSCVDALVVRSAVDDRLAHPVDVRSSRHIVLFGADDSCYAAHGLNPSTVAWSSLYNFNQQRLFWLLKSSSKRGRGHLSSAPSAIVRPIFAVTVIRTAIGCMFFDAVQDET